MGTAAILTADQAVRTVGAEIPAGQIPVHLVLIVGTVTPAGLVLAADIMMLTQQIMQLLQAPLAAAAVAVQVNIITLIQQIIR